MKLTIERAALLPAIAAAGAVVEARNTIPIIGHLRLVAAGRSLKITGTDLDMEASESAEAHVQRDGALTVPAGLFSDIARKLPDGVAIGIEATDTGALLISGRSRFRLPTLPVEDFPDLATAEMEATFVLPSDTLLTMIDAVAFAMSREETRYYLNGFYWHIVGDDLVAVATDGHRLSMIRRPAPEGAAGMPGIIVPAKTARMLARLAKAGGDAVVSVAKSKLRVSIGQSVLLSKVVDGTYPDYARVIPQGEARETVIDGGEWASALDRVCAMKTESKAVRLTFADRTLAMRQSSPDAGEAFEEIDIDWPHAELTIGGNGKYLLEMLASLEEPSLQMRLVDPGSPMTFSGQGGKDDGRTMLLMPMRA